MIICPLHLGDAPLPSFPSLPFSEPCINRHPSESRLGSLQWHWHQLGKWPRSTLPQWVAGVMALETSSDKKKVVESSWRWQFQYLGNSKKRTAKFGEWPNIIQRWWLVDYYQIYRLLDVSSQVHIPISLAMSALFSMTGCLFVCCLRTA